MSKTVPVFEVLHDTNGEGPACDGTAIRRFRDEGAASQFAASATSYGHPATFTEANVPERLARRWGLA